MNQVELQSTPLSVLREKFGDCIAQLMLTQRTGPTDVALHFKERFPA
jgi:hypothetical protein